MPLGPNARQSEMLQALGEDPENFRDKTTQEVANFLELKIKQATPDGIRQQERGLKDREIAISQKRLAIGSEIRVATGPNKGLSGVITEITPDKYIVPDFPLKNGSRLSPRSVELL